MAFIMRSCEKLFRSLCCLVVLLLAAQSVQALEISVREPQLSANDEGYILSANFNINFNSRLEEAVNKGVVLYFTVDFDLSRSRWYWLNEQVVRKSKTFQLSYHALTRQYRLSTGALHQTFVTQEEALKVLSRIRNWPVLEKGAVKYDQTYQAGLRMYLDLAQMPKTFQVSALANKDWAVSSDWVRWKFTPSEGIELLAPVSALQDSSSVVPLTGSAPTAAGEAK